MLNKFESLCEVILESNKGDLEQVKKSMIEALGLKKNNFSEIKYLPDNTARMRVVAPNNKMMTDDVVLIDAKNGKYIVNGLNTQELKTTSVEKVLEIITKSDDVEPEEKPQPEAEKEEQPEEEPEEETPEGENEAPEENPQVKEKPEPKEEDDEDDVDKMKKDEV